jgi:hypothetical protein
MRRISSRWTFFYKRIFPVIWFGLLPVFVAVSLFANAHGGSSSLFPFLIVPAAMLVFGYVIMKKLVFDLVDEVWDDGNELVVRNRGQEQRIALSDIKNVSYSALTSPPRVILALRRPSIFGDQIAFCAPVRFVPFTTSPVIDDLINRIDVARQRLA